MRSTSLAVEADESKNWASLIVNEFPSNYDGAMLLEVLQSKGFDIESVHGKSKSKTMDIQKGKFLFAFVNCCNPEAAQQLKKACDEKRVEITDSIWALRTGGSSQRTWLLNADWARSGGCRKAKPKSKKPKSEEPVTKEMRFSNGAGLTATLKPKEPMESSAPQAMPHATSTTLSWAQH